MSYRIFDLKTSLVLLVFVFLSTDLISQQKNWKLFKDVSLGYSIEYPGDWIGEGGKGGFMCGKEGGFVNAEWTIWLSEVDNEERIDFIFNDEDLFDDYEVVEKPMEINGIKGAHQILTNVDRPGEYIEQIILKTDSVWYKIENAGIKDERFKHFYSSFKLMKK